MTADYKRINRLLQIYLLIQGGSGWTAKKLADECKTVERSIFRDIKVLRDVGVPLFHDTRSKCYKIHRDYYMPAVELTFDESLALVALGKSIHDKEQIPFSRPALKALAKIRGQLPMPIQRELDLVEERLTIRLAPSATQEGFAAYYDRVRKALAAGTALRCSYESIGGGSKADDPQFFLLKPYALFFSQRAWYVVGYHGQRDDIRTLKLNRFSAMEPTEHRYTIPKEFKLDKHLGHAWRMIRGNRRYDVELLFDPAFAENISDTAWHATQSFEHEEGGGLRFFCTVDGLDEIVWWVLSMGAHCKVIQPPELQTLVETEVKKTLALYATGAAARTVAVPPASAKPAARSKR